VDNGLSGTGVGAAAEVLVLLGTATVTVTRWGEHLAPTCSILPSTSCHALTPASHDILTHKQGGGDTESTLTRQPHSTGIPESAMLDTMILLRNSERLQVERCDTPSARQLDPKEGETTPAPH